MMSKESLEVARIKDARSEAWHEVREVVSRGSCAVQPRVGEARSRMLNVAQTLYRICAALTPR